VLNGFNVHSIATPRHETGSLINTPGSVSIFSPDIVKRVDSTDEEAECSLDDQMSSMLPTGLLSTDEEVTRKISRGTLLLPPSLPHPAELTRLIMNPLTIIAYLANVTNKICIYDRKSVCSLLGLG